MAEPMRTILLLADTLGVHDEGWSIRPFLDRLARQGVSAQVLCTAAAGDAALDPRVIVAHGLASRWRLPFAVRGLRFGAQQQLSRPELLHVLQSRMGEAGLAIAEHARLPVVQSLDEFVPHGGRLRLSRRWCRRLVTTSRALADDLISALGVPPEWVAVVNPGIEAPAEASLRSRGVRVPVIGASGTLVAGSGFATFLNAARKVVDAGIDAEFVIAGQGSDEVDLRRRAHRLRISDRVTFAGIPVVGMRFWSVLDVYCQPAVTPTVGRALAAALSFGVPCIASNIGGLRALVTQGQTGWLIPPGDSSALAEQILAVLGDHETARAAGQAGRELILREYDPGIEAILLAAVYRDALDRPTALVPTPRAQAVAPV